MTNRPDLDMDAQRLRERGSDVWDVHQLLSNIGNTVARPLILGHFAAAFLHAAVLVDIAGLQERGARSVPACHGYGSTLEVHSPDRTRVVLCTHTLEHGYVELIYCYQDQGRSAPRTSRRIPTVAVNEAQLPTEVRQNADEIRAFLLDGKLPAMPARAHG